MKLPKGFGGNMGNVLQQAQAAMEKAKKLEEELKLEVVEAEKNGVSVKYSGAGEILSMKIAPDLVDPQDVETLEDLVLMAVREGAAKAQALRESKMEEIRAGLPNIPGM